MQFLLNHCHVVFSEHSNILLTLLLAGLVSGFTHCAGMCGPFVMAQVRCDNECDTTLKRLSGKALLPYHLGRMTTYIMLGVIAALLSKQILGTPLQHWLAVSFLTIAGIVFIASALPRGLGNYVGSHSHHSPAWLSKLAAPFFKNPRNIRGYILGLLLGLLPCAVIFAAMMAVATTGSPVAAALGMALFTLGTFPALFFVGIFSRIALKRWPNMVKHVARAVMVCNGINLFAIAGHMAVT